MSYNNIAPAWLFLIPLEELDRGDITKQEFLDRIDKESSIPDFIKEAWHQKLEKENDYVEQLG